MMRVHKIFIKQFDIIFLVVELSTLGIYPQLNKQVFVRDLVDIINKDLNMVSILYHI